MAQHTPNNLVFLHNIIVSLISALPVTEHAVVIDAFAYNHHDEVIMDPQVGFATTPHDFLAKNLSSNYGKYYQRLLGRGGYIRVGDRRVFLSDLATERVAIVQSIFSQLLYQEVIEKEILPWLWGDHDPIQQRLEKAGLL